MTSLPFVSILDAAASECAERFPGKTAEVLATAGTLKTGIYDRALTSHGVPFILPDEDDIARLMRVIYDGVKKGAELEGFRSDWETVLENGRRRGAGVFILACTELPIAAAAFGTKAPFIDATEALARAAVRFCGYETV
jgi:aspartate racemase